MNITEKLQQQKTYLKELLIDAKYHLARKSSEIGRKALDDKFAQVAHQCREIQEHAELVKFLCEDLEAVKTALEFITYLSGSEEKFPEKFIISEFPSKLNHKINYDHTDRKLKEGILEALEINSKLIES